jgi:hypothetical protein
MADEPAPDPPAPPPEDPFLRLAKMRLPGEIAGELATQAVSLGPEAMLVLAESLRTTLPPGMELTADFARSIIRFEMLKAGHAVPAPLAPAPAAPAPAAPAPPPEPEPGSLTAIAKAYNAKFGGGGGLGLKQIHGRQNGQTLPPAPAPAARPDPAAAIPGTGMRPVGFYERPRSDLAATVGPPQEYPRMPEDQKPGLKHGVQGR